MGNRFMNVSVDGEAAVLDRKTHKILFGSDIKLVDDPRVVSFPGPWKYRHFVDPNVSPEEEMRRTKRLLDELFFPANKLTVGDISIVNKRKKRAAELDQLYMGPKPGNSLDDLFVGNHPVRRPLTLESQKLNEKRNEQITRNKQRIFKLKQTVHAQIHGFVDEDLLEYAEKALGKNRKA